jgi:hypothetical protein
MRIRFLSRGHDAHAGSENVHRYGTLADGSRNTIHASTKLDVEVNEQGEVTAVWFRCLNLPFRVFGRENTAWINPEDMTILNIEYERRDGS